MYDIVFVKKDGVWNTYKINGLKISFNYEPTKEEIIKAYISYCNGEYNE